MKIKRNHRTEWNSNWARSIFWRTLFTIDKTIVKVITKLNDDAQWIKGRARNVLSLIWFPAGKGGRFIGSHIKIIDGGPVNDHVHYHNIRFQMIYVYQVGFDLFTKIKAMNSFYMQAIVFFSLLSFVIVFSKVLLNFKSLKLLVQLCTILSSIINWHCRIEI